MSDVREVISDYIMNHVTVDPNSRFADLTWKQTDHAAGDILATIREALLSDAAVEAMLDGERRWGTGGQCMSRLHPKNRAESMLTAALDAAGLGGEGDDDE